jgi:hypothetical protein
MSHLCLSTENLNGSSVCVRGATLSGSVSELVRGSALVVASHRTVLLRETVVQSMAIARNMLLAAFSSSPKGRRFALTPDFPRLNFKACWRA